MLKSNRFGNGKNITKLLLHLDGNSKDFSGNGNNGTDNAITYVDGKFGKCASFNGSSSKIALPNLGLSGGTARTIIKWIKPNNNSSLQCLYASGTDTPATIFSLFINQATGNFYLYCNNNDYFTGNILIVDAWQQVALVYDGGVASTSTVHIYLNGVAQSLTKSGSGTTAYNTTNSNYELGHDPINGSRYYLGLMDEGVADARAWSAQEVAKYYLENKNKFGLNYYKFVKNLGFLTIVGNIYTLLTQVTSYSLTGINVSLNKFKKLITQTTAYTLTGINVVFKRGRGLAAMVGNFAVTGYDTIFQKSLHLITSLGQYTLTGINVVFDRTKRLVAQVGSYILTGLNISIGGSGTWKWKNDTKPTSSWTDDDKPSSSTWINDNDGNN